MRDGSRTNWIAIVVLWAVGLLAAHQFAKIALILRPTALHYATSEAGAAFLVSAVSAAGLVLGVTAGVTVARVGARRALLVAVALGGAISLMQAATPPYPVMLGLRVLEGASHLLLVVAAPTLMARFARPVDQPFVMGLWATFFGIGFASAALLYPPLAAGPGLSAAWGAHAALLIVAGIAAALSVPPDATSASADTPRGENSFVGAHIATYRSLRTAAAGYVFVWHTAMFVALLGVLPAFIAAEQRGVATAAMPLASLVGTLIGGWASRWLSPLRIAGGSFLLTALAFGALAIGSPPTVDGLLAVGLFFVIGFAPGACYAAVPQLSASDADRARANGAVAQLGNVGTGLGPPLLAAVAVSGDLGLVLLAAGALAAAGCVVAFAVARVVTRGEAAPSPRP